MIRSILISVCFLMSMKVAAQFEYFNEIYGSDEASSNIEVVGEEIIIMGIDHSGVDDCWFFRKFNEQGQQLSEKCYFFPDEFHYLGLTNTFQKVPGQDRFLHTQGVLNGGLIKGSAMMLDLELDTVWKHIYEEYDPDTYFTTHTWDGDGFIIAGETLEPGDGRGTFIMKIDILGNVLWHQLIHDPSEGIFRNLDISVVEGGYVWSGGDGVLSETEGYIELINENLESEYLLTGVGGVERLYMRHLKWSIDSIIAFQPIADSYVPGGGAATYRKLRIYMLDPDIPSLQTIVDFEPYTNWINGYGIKMIRNGNSPVVVGTYRTGPNTNLRTESFLVKFDGEFNQDWYTELFYDDCPTCENILYDIERAPDGGYIMVGEFTDTSIDFNPRTWLVKVDACGDLEWQGCAPVGIGEWALRQAQGPLELWPNPIQSGISTSLNVRLPSEDPVVKVEMVDMMGRISDLSIEDLKFDNRSQILQISTPQIPSGLHTILVSVRNGQTYSAKMIVE